MYKNVSNLNNLNIAKKTKTNSDFKIKALKHKTLMYIYLKLWF
jgi:hypothetical protein